MWLKDIPKSFETPEEFEKAWEAAGGGSHPTYVVPWTDKGPQFDLVLTKEEHDFIMEVRRRNDPSFYERMKAYMDLFERR